MGRVVAARRSALALLLGELGLAPAIAAALEDEDLDVVGESVDEGDGARGIGGSAATSARQAARCASGAAQWRSCARVRAST